MCTCTRTASWCVPVLVVMIGGETSVLYVCGVTHGRLCMGRVQAGQDRRQGQPRCQATRKPCVGTLPCPAGRQRPCGGTAQPAVFARPPPAPTTRPRSCSHPPHPTSSCAISCCRPSRRSSPCMARREAYASPTSRVLACREQGGYSRMCPGGGCGSMACKLTESRSPLGQPPSRWTMDGFYAAGLHTAPPPPPGRPRTPTQQAVRHLDGAQRP